MAQMITAGRINVGQNVYIPMTFLDTSGATYDPATVVFSLVDPQNVKSTYTYGTDSEVTKTATGKYKAKIAPDMAGRWFYRWAGDTTNVLEQDFVVHDSVFFQTTFSGDYV